MTKLSRNEFKKEINSKLKAAKEVITKFKAELDEDPSHALEWSPNVFSAAAKVQILRVALHHVEHATKPVETSIKVAQQEAWRLARFPKSSSNLPAMAMSQALMEQWADFVETYKDCEDAE